jgi:hypothetical protein
MRLKYSRIQKNSSRAREKQQAQHPNMIRCMIHETGTLYHCVVARFPRPTKHKTTYQNSLKLGNKSEIKNKRTKRKTLDCSRRFWYCRERWSWSLALIVYVQWNPVNIKYSNEHRGKKKIKNCFWTVKTTVIGTSFMSYKIYDSYKTLINPILLYGNETRTLTERE